MSTYICRPTSVISSGGGTNPAADVTVLTNLGDNSDVTTVNNTGTKSLLWTFGLGAASVPATEFVARVGTSLRWKGNAAGNYSIGGLTFRSSDATPGYVASLTPNNSAAFTSTQVGYQSVAWSRTDVNSLRYLWFDGRSNSAWAQTDHADIWASVYTLTLASATPANRTETTSVYPTISVTANATIDWESTSYDWQNLRKVTVEVRIESGGTGTGAGTLVSLGSATTLFTATGSKVLTVVMPDALPNGTYNIYARALRYREDGLVYSDAYGSWSAAATLTMSTPLPNTPTVSVTEDQDQDRVTISVTPVATSGYTSPFIYVQRSSDGGITWSAVRGASGIAGSFGLASTFYDYEAPRDQAVFYRAQVQASYSGFVNGSAWSAGSPANIAADTWNIKNPLAPSQNFIGVNVVGRPQEQQQEDLGIFRPLGRSHPVVVAGALGGWDGEISLVCTSVAEWESVKALAAAQAVLLLESPFGDSRYIRLTAGAKSELAGTKTAPQRRVGLAYVEVDAPSIVVGETTADSIPAPALIDGGTASSVFGDFYDGGTAISTQTSTFDGGAAV